MGGRLHGQPAAPGGRPGERLTVDPQLELELGYCVPLGIPHSQFLAWSADDQDKAIAYTVRQRARCPSCGTNPDEWVTAGGDPVIPPPYEPTTHVCMGCADKERYDKSMQDEPVKGGYTVLVPSNWAEYDEDEFVGPSRAEV